MDALRQFLGAVAFIAITAGIFAAARPKSDLGSAADWAGAGANLLVVLVSLWLADSERRRVERIEKSATAVASQALRDCLDLAIEFGEELAGEFDHQNWPDEELRTALREDLHAVGKEWGQFDVMRLPLNERRIANRAEDVMHDFQRETAKPLSKTNVTRLDAEWWRDRALEHAGRFKSYREELK